MKHVLRLASLALAAVLTVGLFTGCGFLKKLEEEDEPINYAPAGGTVSFPEGFAPSGGKSTLETVMMDTTLCGAFTQVATSRSTSYFYPGSDTLTVSAKGTTDGVLEEFRINLWKRTESGAEFVASLHFPVDGSVASGTFTGLDPNTRYRLSVAFSGSTTSCTGGFNASPIGNLEPQSEGTEE